LVSCGVAFLGLFVRALRFGLSLPVVGLLLTAAVYIVLSGVRWGSTMRREERMLFEIGKEVPKVVRRFIQGVQRRHLVGKMYLPFFLSFAAVER